MRILLQTSTYGYKTYHALAKRIKEQFPETIFGLPGVAAAAENFIKKQTEIEYEIFDMDHGDVNEYEIDFDELRKFEEKLPQKSLWRWVSTDRGLGRAFLHGAIGYDNHGPYHRDYILKYCTKRIKRIREIFDEFKPDIFIPAIAMGDIAVIIIEEVCKENGVLNLVPDSVRVQNYCTFSPNSQLTFPEIDDLAKKLINDEIKLDKMSAEKLFNQLVSELKDSDYFDSKNARLQEVEFRGRSHRIFFMIGAISYYIITIIINNFVMYF